MDTSELTKAVDNFTAAVGRLETLLAKEDEDDDEEDAEKAKKAEDEEDEEDSEEKAKKALEVLKEQGYDVDSFTKVSVDRGNSQPMRKNANEVPRGNTQTYDFVSETLKAMGVE